jgi:hypothetical protein
VGGVRLAKLASSRLTLSQAKPWGDLEWKSVIGAGSGLGQPNEKAELNILETLLDMALELEPSADAAIGSWHVIDRFISVNISTSRNTCDGVNRSWSD